MSWIKRNLFFVIGAAIALILMVGAGFYTWSGYSHNAKALEDITGKYTELKRLYSLKPNPGNEKVNNIKAAREQQAEVQATLARAATLFDPIPGIPDTGTNVTVESFTTGLAQTIARLQREAANASVLLPPKYNFSFEQPSRAMKFSAGSLPPLSVQLGEVKAICDVLIEAKVNALDGVQRERVSPDDNAGPQSDYLDQHTITNELALISPYQISFRCFTPELALVLCGFSASPHRLVVKSINVEPAPALPVADVTTPAPIYVPPVAVTPSPTPGGGRPGEGGVSPAFRERYGLGAGGKFSAPAPAPVAPVYAQPGAVAASTALKTVLNEKQLKVTLLVQVVKLLPKK